MKILAVEPFYGGSHKQWLDSLTSYSSFEFKLLTLPARWFKWRMYGGAITLARKFQEISFKPDLIIVSDMLDLALFKSLTNLNAPHFLYFHENQFAYPENIDNSIKFDNHYRFINYKSALCANFIAFNSKYNKDTFFIGVQNMLKSLPEYRNMNTLDEIKKKSMVLPLGVELNDFHTSAHHEKINIPVILWNHRWEHDKNPEEFFTALINIKKNNIKFKLIVCGQQYEKAPSIFIKAKKILKNEIVHFKFAESRNDYITLLRNSDIIPVTSIQDFFGVSIIEAVFSGCIPVLPKRLAYTEIFNPNKFNECYYTQNFEDKLTDVILNINNYKINLSNKLKKEIYKYNWPKMISKYETLFKKVIEKHE
ncbi:MAG: DUF3524 domain-containing protein [Spirochaetia bacterium]|nr:DUF3524 domain-containing protein [Spirochaetia bacterium]